jgi:hypothetical protein
MIKTNPFSSFQVTRRESVFQGYALPKPGASIPFMEARRQDREASRLQKEYEKHVEAAQKAQESHEKALFLAQKCDALVEAMGLAWKRGRGFLDLELELYEALEELEALEAGATEYYLQSRDCVYNTPTNYFDKIPLGSSKG